jgi:tetratricopeptide (TPR) repeat protein
VANKILFLRGFCLSILDPNDAASLFHFAKFLDKGGGRLDEAEEYYLHALEIDANLPLCLKEYGHFLTEKRGLNEVAAPFYRRATQVMEALADGHTLLDATHVRRLQNRTSGTPTPSGIVRRLPASSSHSSLYRCSRTVAARPLCLVSSRFFSAT